MTAPKEIRANAGIWLWPTTIVVGFILSVTCCPAMAAEQACTLTPIGRHTVAAVIDAATIKLDDGREVRLADIKAPHASDVASSRDGDRTQAAASHYRRPVVWPLEALVVANLEKRLVGRTVVVATDRRAGDTLVDRYGRLTAHILADEQAQPHPAGDGGWLQAALLKDGLVRLAYGPGEAPCLARLLVHEQSARRQHHGIWRDAAHAARDAHRPNTLYALTGTLQAVEGRIARIETARSRIRLHFEPRGGRDVTISLRRKLSQAMTAGGENPSSLVGRRVRVTGWLEWRDGPRIDIRHREQLEIVEP